MFFAAGAGMTASPYTSEFQLEFQAETSRLLRRRFYWFAGVIAAVSCLQILMVAGEWITSVADTLSSEEGAGAAAPAVGLARRSVVHLGHDALTFALYAGALWLVWSRRISQATLLGLSLWCIVLDGGVDIAAAVWLGRPERAVWGVLFAHALAAALLPWTPRQAVFPAIPLLILNTLTWLVYHGFSPPTPTVMMVIASPLVFAPGVVIAGSKFARRMQDFKLRYLQSRYGQVRRELVDARRIHEALLPHPTASESILFDFRYEPMLQIGGDYVFARHDRGRLDEPETFNAVLIDVTGHGIAAALTVNRLHGELERLYAEHPNPAPGDVLRALNKYVHLTLANHSVYVTALCLRVDTARSRLEYASGGHPPAFLRGVDGTVDQLNATGFVLGACPDSSFDPEPQTRHFGPGDSLIAYTDGAIEARDDRGRMLGVAGLMRVIASGTNVRPGGWVGTVLEAVDSHRAGPPADDTIVIEITRPLADSGAPMVDVASSAGVPVAAGSGR
jgi:serine phosphatase RsbU (regulator of sigma subunit)